MYLYIYLFQREGKGERKRGKEILIGCLLSLLQLRIKPTTEEFALPRNKTNFPFALWDKAKPIEPHLLGLISLYFYSNFSFIPELL